MAELPTLSEDTGSLAATMIEARFLDRLSDATKRGALFWIEKQDPEEHHLYLYEAKLDGLSLRIDKVNSRGVLTASGKYNFVIGYSTKLNQLCRVIEGHMHIAYAPQIEAAISLIP